MRSAVARADRENYFSRWVSVQDGGRRIFSGNSFAIIMRYRYPFEPARGDTPLEKAIALELVSDMDLLRLKAIARVHARGLPGDVGWGDVLQEAFARVLNGSRRRPEGVPLEAFMSGVMRSIRAEHWRRVRRDGERHAVSDRSQTSVAAKIAEVRDPAPDPERALLAQQELEAIGKLFADDNVVLRIIVALGDGLSAEEICATLALSRTEYDSARKRMRRALLREGLRMPVP
jgi:DNA-directed RNA polymerase specialized sigma24 family protein